MDDRAILDCIQGLVAEESRVRDQHERGALSQEAEAARLRELEDGLDQMWNLLRQRRALRAAGMDPDTASPVQLDTWTA